MPWDNEINELSGKPEYKALHAKHCMQKRVKEEGTT